MENENNMENLENTTSQEVPGAEQNADEQAEGTTQSEAEQNAEEGSESSQSAKQDVFLPIRYNHEDILLTREEAVKYAQLGKLYSESGFDMGKLKPIYNKLDYIAAQNDMSIEDLVDGLISKDEADYRAELEAKFGAEDTETVESLLQIRRNNQQEKYNKMLESRKNAETKQAEEKEQNLNTRLANEFIELNAEFPEIVEFKDLPAEVKSEAVKTGKDLLSCFLRYKHSENKKISAAKQNAENNSKAGTGAMNTSETDNISDAEKRFKNALWGI